MSRRWRMRGRSTPWPVVWCVNGDGDRIVIGRRGRAACVSLLLQQFGDIGPTEWNVFDGPANGCRIDFFGAGSSPMTIHRCPVEPLTGWSRARVSS